MDNKELQPKIEILSTNYLSHNCLSLKLANYNLKFEYFSSKQLLNL